MKTILQVVLVTDAILLITLILLQNRGTALGTAFGGDSSVHYERRGGEKVIHYITIGAVVVFVLVSLGSLFVQ